MRRIAEFVLHHRRWVVIGWLAAAVENAFSTVASKVPDTRLVDEFNSGGDKAFRTTDNRTAYALLFYRFLHNPTAKLPTDAIRSALTAAAPAGAQVGLTGEDAL